MSGPFANLWWDEPDYLVPGLLSVVAATLGGDLVLWVRVDAVSGQATVLDMVEPNPEAQGIAERLRTSELPPPESLGTSVARSGQSRLVPLVGPSEFSVDTLPQPWQEYLATFPIVGTIAVPVTLDDGATGVLITARRTTTAPYTPDDLRFVESGARRLAGSEVDASLVGESETPDWSLKQILGSPRRWFRLREILVGAGPPALITAVVGSMNDSAKFHPGALLLLGCVLAAVFSGVRAAILSAVASMAALWWAFTPSEMSWRFATRSDAIGVALFLAALIGVILLVFRLDEVRNKERLERQFSDLLLEQSPVAMAVFDRDLRFRRVNRPMAEMNGRAAADHVGLRPGDLSPLAGQMYEHLLARVRDSGQPIADHKLRISMPKLGFERDWKLSLRPLHNQESEVVGIGVTIIDVTQEIVRLRHAEQLFHLAESLSTAFDEQQIAEGICSFLAETLHGRSAVAFRHDEALVLTTVLEFGDDEASRLRGAIVGLYENTPINDALLMNRSIILPDGTHFDKRYPHLA
ncbi:MAG: PAS domain-containing protein, partial [Ilumatobacteraceae bacterium]